MKILRKVEMVADKKQKKADSYKWESTASMALGNLMRLKDFSKQIKDPEEAKRLRQAVFGGIKWEIDMIEQHLDEIK